MNYKNRKPKRFKGCCAMCALQDSNGTRCGRLRTKQEQAAELKQDEGVFEDIGERSNEWFFDDYGRGLDGTVDDRECLARLECVCGGCWPRGDGWERLDEIVSSHSDDLVSDTYWSTIVAPYLERLPRVVEVTDDDLPEPLV